MAYMQVIVGYTYATLPVLLAPFYIRIIYIFIIKAKYRNLDCYRIMIQIGIIQCLMAPTFFFVGLTHVLGYDPYQLASNGMKFMSASVRMEASLSFVLALDRLKIICNLQYPRAVHTTLVVLTWVYGVIYTATLMTPYAGYVVVPGEFLSKYDERPLSQLVSSIGTYTIMVLSSLTVLVYFIIIGYLVRLHFVTRTKRAFNSERSILIYAVVRFCVDFVLCLCYRWAHRENKPLFDFLTYLGYILNNLLLSTILYLLIYKPLRKEFLLCRWGKARVGTYNVGPAAARNQPYSIA